MNLATAKILGMDLSPFLLFVLCLVCAYASGRMADKKGYSYAAFAAIGFFIPIIGLIIAAVLPDKNASPNQTAAQQIADYKKLLDDGAITQDEYDAKKRELLS